jgi:hypothetical protein
LIVIANERKIIHNHLTELTSEPRPSLRAAAKQSTITFENSQRNHNTSINPVSELYGLYSRDGERSGWPAAGNNQHRPHSTLPANSIFMAVLHTGLHEEAPPFPNTPLLKSGLLSVDNLLRALLQGHSIDPAVGCRNIKWINFVACALTQHDPTAADGRKEFS